MYRHFAGRHPGADIIILGDRNVVKCDLCGQKCYNLESHKKTGTCKKLALRRRNEKMQDLQAKANRIEFFINGKSIERVKKFKYLGRWFTDNDDDTLAIMENIKKARNQWNSLANILKSEGANSVCMGRFYLAIVQAVLLYGAD